MRPIHLSISALYKLCVCLFVYLHFVLICFLTCILPDLPIHFFQNMPVPSPEVAGGNETGFSFFGFILCCGIFCFVVFDLVFQYLAKRLAGKNVS